MNPVPGYNLSCLLLLLSVHPTQCGVHSLTGVHSLIYRYIYIVFSKPVQLPGIHEFIAMAQLDGQMIQYYDSVNQRLVPKQTWMEERLPAEYWVEGTQVRQYKQQWFEVNINILMKRRGQNDADTHILEWNHGCEGDMQPDGKLKFKQGWDGYNYDGKDLRYDYIQGRWVDQTEAAKEWESSHLQEYNRGQQELCIEWLSKLITYAVKQLQTAPPTDVFVFAKNTKVSANAVLVCLATGFYSNDTKLQIRKDKRMLDKDDGVMSSGVRPNGINGTFQRRDEVEIVRADDSQFTCEVNHKASNFSILKVWDHVLPTHVDPNGVGGFIDAVVCALVVWIVVLAVVVLVVLYKKRIICGSGRSRRGSTPSLNTKSTEGSDIPLKPVAEEVRGGSVDGSDSGVSTNSTPPSESASLMGEEALSPPENYQDSLSSLQPT